VCRRRHRPASSPLVAPGVRRRRVCARRAIDRSRRAVQRVRYVCERWLRPAYSERSDRVLRRVLRTRTRPAGARRIHAPARRRAVIVGLALVRWHAGDAGRRARRDAGSGVSPRRRDGEPAHSRSTRDGARVRRRGTIVRRPSTAMYAADRAARALPMATSCPHSRRPRIPPTSGSRSRATRGRARSGELVVGDRRIRSRSPSRR
jgi:hypothetical protein